MQVCISLTTNRIIKKVTTILKIILRKLKAGFSLGDCLIISSHFIGKITKVQGLQRGGSEGEESTCSAGDLGVSLGWEDSLEEGMAIHSSILAWRVPMDKGGWQVRSIVSQRSGQD